MPLTPGSQRTAQKQVALATAANSKGSQVPASNTTAKTEVVASKKTWRSYGEQTTPFGRTKPSRWAEQDDRVGTVQDELDGFHSRRDCITKKIALLYKEKTELDHLYKKKTAVAWEKKKQQRDLQKAKDLASGETEKKKKERTAESERQKEVTTMRKGLSTIREEQMQPLIEKLSKINKEMRGCGTETAELRELYDKKYLQLFGKEYADLKQDAASRAKWGGPHIRYMRERNGAIGVVQARRSKLFEEAEKLRKSLDKIKADREKLKEELDGKVAESKDKVGATAKNEGKEKTLSEEEEEIAELDARWKCLVEEIQALKDERSDLYEEETTLRVEKERLSALVQAEAWTAWLSATSKDWDAIKEARDSWWYTMSEAEQLGWEWLSFEQRGEKGSDVRRALREQQRRKKAAHTTPVSETGPQNQEGSSPVSLAAAKKVEEVDSEDTASTYSAHSPARSMSS